MKKLFSLLYNFFSLLFFIDIEKRKPPKGFAGYSKPVLVAFYDDDKLKKVVASYNFNNDFFCTENYERRTILNEFIYWRKLRVGEFQRYMSEKDMYFQKHLLHDYLRMNLNHYNSDTNLNTVSKKTTFENFISKQTVLLQSWAYAFSRFEPHPRIRLTDEEGECCIYMNTNPYVYLVLSVLMNFGDLPFITADTDKDYISACLKPLLDFQDLENEARFLLTAKWKYQPSFNWVEQEEFLPSYN